MLRELSAAAIVAAIADAADRWSNADFPPRVRVTRSIEARLRYSEPVVDYALDALFGSLTAGALETAIAGELGSLAALDGPVSRAGGSASYARGVERVVLVSSETTIGVALLPAIYALCAKCAVVVKDRNDALIASFFASLIDERPEFGDAAIARTWTGGDDPDEATLLGAADVVVAFGGDSALRAIRTQLRADTRFIAFGHRASIGFIDVATLPAADRLAVLDGIAAATVLYDGEGCLSLHALFVAGAPSAVAAFVADLATAFERMSIEFPAGERDAQSAASVAAYQQLGAFRAAGGRGTIYAPGRSSATVAFDPPRDLPPPFLPRVLPVFPVTDAADVAAYVQLHRIPVMALGVSDPAAPAALALAQAAGAVRVSRFERMQHPPIGGHHGGAPRIADYVRWIDCA